MVRLPSRQVHLDFHTSELIPGVGELFSKENFQDALRLGHVNSITVFAKCHHSWAYYPSVAGHRHPTLDFDLTGAMIEAAHEIGVRAPIYITVGWSANDARAHPEWISYRRDESMATAMPAPYTDVPEEPLPPTQWIFMCPSGSYAELIYAQTREVCERYPVVDGLFYDICFHVVCHCANCVAGMAAAGLDPGREEDAQAYHVRKWQAFMESCGAVLRERHPEATLFFNGGAHPTQPQWHGHQTHFEMEDLPTSWGGYDKMPPRTKFFAPQGKDYLGMTGKFHTFWGEFGGFKSADALRFECASMLTYGARCSVGDQMHPSGEMDTETYRLIGEAYRYIEQIEEWAFDGEETTRLGVYPSPTPAVNEGVAKMLLEKQLDFDMVLPHSDLSRCDVLILPDDITLEPEEAARIQAYLEQGGSALLTGQSGLDRGQVRFLLDIGANYQGRGLYKIDYLQIGEALSEGLVRSPFLCYEAAAQVWPTDGEVLATLREPYFDRTYGHYCSHQNTPYRLETARHAGAVRKGRVIYLAHPVCRLYTAHGAQLHRDYFLNALRLLYPDPVLQVTMPSSGRARLMRQTGQSRYVLHLLYATPIQRGRTSVIEDLPPLRDVAVAAHIKQTVTRAYLAPQQAELPFTQEAGVVRLTVPIVQCHQAIVLDY